MSDEPDTHDDFERLVRSMRRLVESVDELGRDQVDPPLWRLREGLADALAEWDAAQDAPQDASHV